MKGVTVTENNNHEEFNKTRKFDVSEINRNGAQAHPARPIRSAQPTAVGNGVNTARTARPNQPAVSGAANRTASRPAVRTDRPVYRTVNPAAAANSANAANTSVRRTAAVNRPMQAQNQQVNHPTEQPARQAAQNHAAQKVNRAPHSVQQNEAHTQVIPKGQIHANVAQTSENPDSAKTQNLDVKSVKAQKKAEAAPRAKQENEPKKSFFGFLKTDKKKDPENGDDSSKSKKDKPRRSETTNTVVSAVKAVIYIVFVIVISAFIASELLKIGNDVFAFVKTDEEIEVTIPENATVDDVAKILDENGVISYPKIFSLYAKVRHDSGEYLAGTYTVTPMMNYDYLMAEFKPKAVSGTCEITIPEGFTTDEIIDLMVEAGIGTREGYVDVIENGDFDYWFIDELEEEGVSDDRIYRLDGYLFPDTYQFYLASSEWTVINKLLRRFEQIFTKEYRDQCDALGYTVDEVVTLASIIEKEAASPSEFFLVSSVFHNRLNASQSFPRFESDATVVYAIQHETGERTVDLNYDTPYNTYKYDGFTPGPIANPSASAMLAALSPQNTNYYFFISNDGVTYFSATKAEHDAYVKQFADEKAKKASTES